MFTICILSRGISGRKSYSALWVLHSLHAATLSLSGLHDICLSEALSQRHHLCLLCAGMFGKNLSIVIIPEHDCWINKNTSCWADEPWMLIWCLEVLQSPIPWQQPVVINCTWVGINSSLFLCRGIDGFWSQHTWCTVEGFSEYCMVLGNIFLEAVWKERKTAVMNLNGGKKSKRDLTN